MTQAIKPIAVDAKTADWPRKVANALNRLQNTTASSGGTAAWGGITGTLSNQTDLQTALNAKQGLDATLTALAAYNTNGLLTQTAADTFTGRTITAGSAKITIANGSGVSGNPTVDLGSVASTDLSDTANIARLNGGQTFTADISVPDEAYGAGWDGSNEVPTKNALYDKIETISGGGVSDGDKGDITVSSSGTVWTVDNDAISYAKIQNVSAASRLLGRGSAGGAGDTEELTAGLGLEISSTTLRRATGTSFPGSPSTGDLFWRSDRNIEYVYDGTRWLSTQIFTLEAGVLDAIFPKTATGTTSAVGNPWSGLYDIYVLETAVWVLSLGTLNWTIAVASVGTGAATLSSYVVSTATEAVTRTTVNAVVPSTIIRFNLVLTENSGTGSVYVSPNIIYRLIG